MATVTLTLTLTGTNAYLNIGVDSICERFGYTGFEPDGITPQTKQEFVRKHLLKYLKTSIKQHRGANAGSTSSIASELDIETNLIFS